MCGCEAHQNDLSKCTCLCEEHDTRFNSDVIILRKAVRRLSAEGEARAGEVRQLHHSLSGVWPRLRGVEDELSSSHNAFTPPKKDLPPDKFDDDKPDTRSPFRWWIQVPLTSVIRPDTPIRLTLTGPAGDGWDGSVPHTFHWGEDWDGEVTVEIPGF